MYNALINTKKITTMKSSWIFESWHQWRVCFVSGVKKMFWGFGRIVTCIILGIVSIFVWVWKCAVRLVGRYPQVALGAFIVIALVICLLMYARNRAMENGLTAQRDNIAWQYQNFKETHGYE